MSKRISRNSKEGYLYIEKIENHRSLRKSHGLHFFRDMTIIVYPVLELKLISSGFKHISKGVAVPVD